jgi:prepilin-type N-terminal cleavage/methylation domain-containing protein
VAVSIHALKTTKSGGRRGGTLIEVLISILIISLVLSTVLNVSAHKRAVISNARKGQVAMDLAMQWRSARLANARWAQGMEGTFPDRDGPRWTLEPLPQMQVTESGLAADSQWQQLCVLTAADDSVGTLYLMRVNAPGAALAGANP